MDWRQPPPQSSPCFRDKDLRAEFVKPAAASIRITSYCRRGHKETLTFHARRRGSVSGSVRGVSDFPLVRVSLGRLLQCRNFVHTFTDTIHLVWYMRSRRSRYES